MTSEVLAARSQQRFEKVSAVVREFFAKDPEVAEEAISLAKNMLSVARAEILIKAATSEAEPIDFFVDLFKVDRAGDEVSVPDRSLREHVEARNEAPEYLDHVVNFQRNELLKSATVDSSWHEPIGVVQKSDGGPLAKAECSSRMYALFQKIRPFASDVEAQSMEKAIACLDFALFAQLAEPVIGRMKH